MEEWKNVKMGECENVKLTNVKMKGQLEGSDAL